MCCQDTDSREVISTTWACDMVCLLVSRTIATPYGLLRTCHLRYNTYLPTIQRGTTKQGSLQHSLGRADLCGPHSTRRSKVVPYFYKQKHVDTCAQRSMHLSSAYYKLEVLMISDIDTIPVLVVNSVKSPNAFPLELSYSP
jgi:hypothetical protein